MEANLKAVLNAYNQAALDAADAKNAAYRAVYREFQPILKADAALQADLVRLEGSSEFGQDECGIYTWARLTFDLPSDPIQIGRAHV